MPGRSIPFHSNLFLKLLYHCSIFHYIALYYRPLQYIHCGCIASSRRGRTATTNITIITLKTTTAKTPTTTQNSNKCKNDIHQRHHCCQQHPLPYPLPITTATAVSRTTTTSTTATQTITTYNNNGRNSNSNSTLCLLNVSTKKEKKNYFQEVTRAWPHS